MPNPLAARRFLSYAESASLQRLATMVGLARRVRRVLHRWVDRATGKNIRQMGFDRGRRGRGKDKRDGFGDEHFEGYQERSGSGGDRGFGGGQGNAYDWTAR